MKSNIVAIIPKPKYQAELEARVENYRALDREIKKLEKIKEEIKKDIINEVGDLSQIHNTSGQVIATYTVETYITFNKEQFILFYPGVYEQFEIKKQRRVFRLK